MCIKETFLKLPVFNLVTINCLDSMISFFEIKEI